MRSCDLWEVRGGRQEKNVGFRDGRHVGQFDYEKFADMTIAVVLLIWWAVLLFPNVVEILSLPPYLGPRSAEDVLLVVRAFPDGHTCPVTGKTMGDALGHGDVAAASSVAGADSAPAVKEKEAVAEKAPASAEPEAEPI